MKKEYIIDSICGVISAAIDGRKQLNRIVLLVDSEEEKKEIVSNIDKTLKQGIPDHSINLYRIDLSNVSSMNELSLSIFQKIYENLDDATKSALGFPGWIEQMKSATGVRGTGIRVDLGEAKEAFNCGYGLFIFDNLDKATEGVINGVKNMYHDGRNCIIPTGWEFISFCGHGAKIWDISFKISCQVCDYNEEEE